MGLVSTVCFYIQQSEIFVIKKCSAKHCSDKAHVHLTSILIVCPIGVIEGSAQDCFAKAHGHELLEVQGHKF